MCIIAAHDKGVIPSMETLRQCKSRNSDGIGIAWVSKHGVEFRRGIGLDKAWRCLQQIEREKAPYVLHFRFATQGGKNDTSLTHPFPVSEKPQVLRTLRGTTARVLAHNGTWSRWREDKEAKDCGFTDRGSDSMFMAYLLAKGYHFPETALKYYHKIAILADDGKLELLGQWQKDSKTGINYSNSGYITYSTSNYSGYWTGYENDYTDAYEGYGYFRWENGVRIWVPDRSKRKYGKHRHYRTEPVVHAQSCPCFACTQSKANAKLVADGNKKTEYKPGEFQPGGAGGQYYVCKQCNQPRGAHDAEKCKKIVARLGAADKKIVTPVMKVDTNGVTHQCFGEFCDICTKAPVTLETTVNDDATKCRSLMICPTCRFFTAHCQCKKDDDVCKLGGAADSKPATAAPSENVLAAWNLSAWCMEPRSNHPKCTWYKCKCTCHGGKVERKEYIYISMDCERKAHEKCLSPSACRCACGHNKHFLTVMLENLTLAVKRAQKDEPKQLVPVAVVPEKAAQGSFLDGPGRDGKTVVTRMNSPLCDCPVRDGEIWHKEGCGLPEAHKGWMERTLDMILPKETERGN